MRISPVSMAMSVLAGFGLVSLGRAVDQPKPLELSSQDDHKKMMEQLKIKEIRRGADGNNSKAANAANSDESKTTPYTKLPEPLVFDDANPVKSAADWKKRRAEIVEHFDREIYGRIPKDVPKVTWEVKETIKEKGRRYRRDHEEACRHSGQLELPAHDPLLLQADLPRRSDRVRHRVADGERLVERVLMRLADFEQGVRDNRRRIREDRAVAQPA